MEIAENQVLKIIFVPVPKDKAGNYLETCHKCCLNNNVGYYVASLQEVTK